MATVLNPINTWEQKYHDILELFVLSDELLDTVAQAENPEEQLALVEPLAETLSVAAEELSQEYIALCEAGGKGDAKAKTRVEAGLRAIYKAAHDVTRRAKDTRNAALAVVKRLKRQMEYVVGNFMEMLSLALDRVMQKQDVEELKQRQAHIALMLHTMSQKAMNPAVS